jgi:hypothetical protein
VLAESVVIELLSEDHGVTVRLTVWVPTFVAVIPTILVVATALVVTVKLALVLPAATETLAGTVATAVRLLEIVTTVPPVGAGPDRVTLPMDGAGPRTVVGLRVSVASVGAMTVKLVVRVAR